ncbi:MAG: hypothetical protein KGL92_16410 [Gammaproteobacteria bacterium]|nr:hypothetical protein [Gammaproteobacteria bacterium]
MSAGSTLRRKFAGTVALGALITGAAHAGTTFVPYLDARIEHDSNVFRASSEAAAFAANGDPTLGDTDEEYVAGMDGTYLWSRQKLTAKIEGRRFDYKHFKSLNHNEYLAELTLDWTLSQFLDGKFDAHQERLMAAFALGNSSRLTVNVDHLASADVDLNINPSWRLVGGGYVHKLDSPLQNFPDFVQRDSNAHVGLDYLGIAKLTYGLRFDRTDGKFENAQNVGPYTQYTGALTGAYQVTGLTTLNAALGYSTRDQTGVTGRVSGITGTFAYSRQLTGKTRFSLSVTRAINSYLAAGGSEVDTTAGGELHWDATYKIHVELVYSYIRSVFVGQIIPGSSANGRVDRSPLEQLKVTYSILRPLMLDLYANHQSRRSNVALFNYTDTTYGLDARYSFR